MKMTKKILCGTLLGCAVALVPMKSNAQTDSDKQFLAFAAQADQDEIAISKVAIEKATNPDVKMFAEKMVKEHMKLTDAMKPYAEKWALTPPMGPDADAQKEIDKLNGLSGKDFDKEYMSQMVSDHAKAYSKFTTEVKDTKLPEFKAAVENGKAVVAAHKNMAYDLKKKL